MTVCEKLILSYELLRYDAIGNGPKLKHTFYDGMKPWAVCGLKLVEEYFVRQRKISEDIHSTQKCKERDF